MWVNLPSDSSETKKVCGMPFQIFFWFLSPSHPLQLFFQGQQRIRQSLVLPGQYVLVIALPLLLLPPIIITKYSHATTHASAARKIINAMTSCLMLNTSTQLIAPLLLVRTYHWYCILIKAISWHPAMTEGGGEEGCWLDLGRMTGPYTGGQGQGAVTLQL